MNKYLDKKELGQYFTKNNVWLTAPVIEFIHDQLPKINTVIDLFAGEGNLFNSFKELISTEKKMNYFGLDIDKNLNWVLNDSLKKIPKISQAMIITNPPYLAKNSCKRKGFSKTYKKYFHHTKYTDLYLIALNKMIVSGLPGIAIVPETLINSNFPKENINRIVVVEQNPFEDTEVPICVVCFNGHINEHSLIYKNNTFILNYSSLKNLYPMVQIKNLVDMKFNDPSGKIAIIGIDSMDPNNKIRFLNIDRLNYDISKIKKSSRAITIVSSVFLNKRNNKELDLIIQKANLILKNFRTNTHDLLLTSFKGNNKLGVRRKRLDFKLAKNILELATQNYKEKEYQTELEEKEME